MKICVVGGGGWGKNHIKTLDKLGHLGAIIDSNNEILNSYSSMKNCQLHNSITESLDFSYDGYIVATPAETHYKIAKDLINNSKNVLIEKPICLNSKESEDLIALAKRNEVFIMGGHLLLFHPAFIKIKEIINSKELGDLLYMYSNRINFGKIRQHENALWSLAPHDISLFLFFANSPITKLHYNGSDILNNKIDDSSISTFEFKNGAKGHIFVNWYNPFKEHKFVIVCSKGMVTYEDSSDKKQVILHKKKHSNFELVDNGIEIVDYDSSYPLDNQLKYFISSVQQKFFNYENIHLSSDVVKILEKLN